VLYVAAWLRKWWWTVVLAIGAIAAAIITIFVFFRRDKPVPMQNFGAKAREQIVAAETDMKIAQLKADAVKKEQETQLNEISKIEDGKERRRRLADYLDENL
jgi:ABC-type bacteriocin/lantibiotic exporter with double-glycine peptidase domain